MASVTPQWAYMLRFPGRGTDDSTNIFGVFFDDAEDSSPYDLSVWFTETFEPASDKPDSFQIWKQKTGREHGLRFLMIDMDQLNVENLEIASNAIEDLIGSEPAFRLRQNNRDAYIAVEWPCICGADRSPFPFFQQSIGLSTVMPNRGIWHDPNECAQPEALSSPELVSGAGSFGYTPEVQPAFVPSAETVIRPRFTSVASSAPFGPIAEAASSTYAPEAAVAAAPTGRIRFAPRFHHDIVQKPTYKVAIPASPYQAIQPAPSYVAVEPPAKFVTSAFAAALPLHGIQVSPSLANLAQYNAITTPVAPPLGLWSVPAPLRML
ncbi:hypothetical protein GGR57DRAFT_507798 [Xylariaceae sp. FL1272]|nr:hypothetical protein GGR57DRAFT_507798 [Xylariaceae sp. FL1272]